MARPNINDIMMVGFEDELQAMRERLCGESPKREVVPIVGMGGIGKTTLARYIYNDKLIVETFCFRAFVTISQEYDAKEILKQLLSIKEPTKESVELLIVKLHKPLIGRRYLIILDDMWSGEAWNAVRRALPEDKNGSRIVITTRISEVANYIDPSAPLLSINLLNNDQSWSLLQKKIYCEESCPLELVEFGIRISEKCKGLPLAIVVIAGVLSCERTLYHWKHIAENTLSSLGEDMFELLSLSYSHLPHYLKPCFLYLGAAFPEDHCINFATLIQLWTAEGFIEPNESKSLEETVEDYLEDLGQRSMVLVERKYDHIKYCRVHDVLREWCIRKAQEEQFLIADTQSNSNDSTANQIRVAFHKSCDGNLSSNDMIDTSQVRTIMFSDKHKGFINRIELCEVLRVLEARQQDFSTSETLNLFHLRYISTLSHSFTVLPSICRLLNLQTLILRGGYQDLPIEIWGMPQLRHLIFPRGRRIRTPPAKTIVEKRFTLPNLQTLYRVGDLTCSTEIVNMMPSLKKLGLYYNGVHSKVEKESYQLSNISSMSQLQNLELSLDPNTIYHRKPTLLSEELIFPDTLTIVKLERCKFPWESMTVVGSLPNLKVLKLENEAFKGEEWETREGEFCQLKDLIMKCMRLESWVVGASNHFPVLKRLCLKKCFHLREIPDSIGEISTIELIELKNCGPLVKASARNIKQGQQDKGNDLLQVRILDFFKIG